MENWETCVFFCFSYSPCCYQASGRGRVYGSTSATKKSILLPKNSHTHSYSVSHVRGSITRHISIQQFSEKNRKYQINFICGRLHQSTAPALRCFFFQSFLFFCSEILLLACILGAISGRTYVTFVVVTRSLIKVKP